MRSSRTNLRRAAAFLLLAAFAALGGCATSPKRRIDVAWPPPPEKPRIRWVKSFATEEHLGASGLRALGRAFLPTKGVSVAQPTGLALSPDEGTLYVSSNGARSIVAIDLVKGTMTGFATAGEERPAAPFGVATDALGNVYVTDHVRNVVLSYAPDGTFLQKFGEAKIERPTGIAIDRRRQVVYVTSGASSKSKHHRVEVFSLKGQHLRTIGTRGGEAGNFNFPVNLAVSREGQLYVVDMLNFRVQVFDPDGQLAGMFGIAGSGEPGTFNKAKGIAFDSFGNVYVVDSEEGFVQMFNSKHQPLMAFAGRSESPGFTRLPTAIAITSRNTIFVADFAAELVHEYELVNTTAADSFTPSDAPPRPPPATPGSPAQPAPTPPGQKPQTG